MSAPPQDRHSLIAERVFDGARLTGPRRVDVADGLVVGLAEGGAPPDPGAATRLAPGVVLAPGLIDWQVNGGGDALLNDAPDAAGAARIAEAHLALGTTALMPTLITDAPDRTEALLAEARGILRHPSVVGLHLEGPHIAPERRGIHPERHVRPMGAADVARLAALADLGRCLVTVAPEVVGAAGVRALIEAGAIVSLGHGAASAAEALGAMDAGASGVTHLFNAMSGLAGRAPGLVGAALDRAPFAGVICDGHHVDAVALRVALRCLGPDRLTLVSDAMPTVGGRRAGFSLMGRAITLADGRLSDEAGTLAGAHLSMAGAVSGAVRLMGASPEDALRMATATPAAFLGLGDGRGAIRPGGRADMVALDEALSVVAVWQGGRRVV